MGATKLRPQAILSFNASQDTNGVHPRDFFQGQVLNRKKYERPEAGSFRTPGRRQPGLCAGQFLGQAWFSSHRPMEGISMRKFLTSGILVFAFCLVLFPAASSAQVAVGVSIHIGPPVLPVYAQPPCPAPGYIWTPGYWAYGPDDYYWIPGVWVVAPRPGFLWTPGYWGFAEGLYVWHGGYWAPHIGFYGGINYGFGYGGVGFVGGRWSGGTFVYNTAVTNVNTTVVRNVYVDKTVINNTTVVNNHYSFNGEGGVTARATASEQAAMREQHVQPTSVQMSHEQTARADRNQLASVNHGRPATASMDKVDGRRYDQQARIANGVRNGELSPKETANLEHREQNINHQVAADRQANGGKLTHQERQQVNKEQNAASRQIYKDKHDEQKERR